MILVIIIGFAIAGWLVQRKLKKKFRTYAQIPLRSGMSGAEAAQRMLSDHGIRDVKVLSVPGRLTDHYNPADKTVNLSEDVYHGRNAAAVAVAAHEVGHAVQHATAYSFLEMRSAMVPVQNVSAKILNFIFMVSIFGGLMFLSLPMEWVMGAIIACYGVITLFSVITLPVEIDASNRALKWVEQYNIVTPNEYDMAKDALNWAGRTYIVAAIASLTIMMYYLLSFFGGKD